MSRRPLDRYLPADAADDYECVWNEFTLERTATKPHRTPRRRLELDAVAQWAAIWRLCETAIERRLLTGDTLSDIAGDCGLTTNALRQIRQGLVWPDSLSAIRLSVALGVDLVVEPARWP